MRHPTRRPRGKAPADHHPGLAAAGGRRRAGNLLCGRGLLVYSSRRYGVEFCDVFARRGRPAAVRASRAIQVAC